MKTSRGIPDMRRRYIICINKLRRKSEENPEKVFLENAIAALKANDDASAVKNLQCCLQSLYFASGDIKLIEVMIEYFSPKKRRIYDSVFIWLYEVLAMIPNEKKIIFLTWLLEQIREKLSIYLSVYMRTKITIDELADILSISVDELLAIVNDANRLYGKKEIPKSNGSTRIIYPPQPRLKILQQRLLARVLYQQKVDDCIGAGKNSSTKKIMKRHIGKKMLIRIDMDNFFPNIKAEKVYRLLKSRGFSTETASVIVKLTTYRGGLPQGAPTSPQLSRLAMSAPIRHIKNLFRFPAEVNLWIDDLVISGPSSIGNHVDTIYQILERYEFVVNKSKTMIMPWGQVQAALGIRVDQGCLEPSEDFMKKYQQALKENYSAKRIAAMRRYINYIRK